jgi:hypothetical protein
MATENGQKGATELYLDHLDAEIAKLVALRAVVASGGDLSAAGTVAAGPLGRRNSVETQVRPDSFHRMSTPGAVRKFLEMMGKGNPQTPQAIAEALIFGNLDTPDHQAKVTNNVYTALIRGQDKEGGFGKVGKLWGLYEWYPTVSPAGASSAGKKRGKKKGKKKTLAKAAHAGDAPKASATPSVRMTYQQFLKAHAKPGKPLAEVGAEWQAYKATMT